MLELLNMKHGAPSALKSSLKLKHFILINLIILIVGLTFLGGLYYILNIQFESPKTPFSNGPVTTEPKSLLFDLEQPEQDTISFSSSILVSGKTSAFKEVLIYTNEDNLIVKSNSDGSFSKKIDLAPFENKITVVVFDSTGKSRFAERTVYYSKEKI